jgi:hypothetical protein
VIDIKKNAGPVGAWQKKHKRALEKEEMIYYLSHIWCKHHGNVAGIHFVGGFLLYDISHEVDSPIKQSSLCGWQESHQSHTFLLSIAIHNLVSCEHI